MCARSSTNAEIRAARRRLERRAGLERRSGADRRQFDIPVEVDRRKKDRRSGDDRRQCPLS